MKAQRIIRLFLAVVIILFLSIFCSAVLADDLLVGPGKPYTTIQAAINAAGESNRVIVDPGTYHENISFNGTNITLRSTDPNNPALTVIQGDGTGSVVTFAGSENSSCVLSGFTITGGNADSSPNDGGGIMGNYTEATITHCIITGNHASDDGGGLAKINGVITNCTITGNSAASQGGGIYYAYTVINCTISDNSSADYGGGLRYIQSTIINCKITNNTAEVGGGIDYCSGSITNCTIAGNTGTIGVAGGLSSCSDAITNCIIWDNGNDPIGNSDTPTYSCFPGGSSGAGNIDADPCFVDPGNGDYHLQADSPCIDVGNNDAVPPDLLYDFDGWPRIIGTVDMGIHEYHDYDCNGNGINDIEDIINGTSLDINGNWIPDECEPDCNGNGIPDNWDIANGTSQDCNGNGIPDECDIANGTSQDIDGDGIPDECEPDCNGNGIPDDWDIATGTSQDIDGDGIPDECEPDCNGNGIPDHWDIATGTSQDVNGNGVPDECEDDCNGNGIPDDWDIVTGTSQDCNGNGIPDECDIANGTSQDIDGDGIPDECEPDCNGNGIPDDWDIATGTSQDVDGDGIPDECEDDCNGNGIPDDWDIATGTSTDYNSNGVPDECEGEYVYVDVNAPVSGDGLSWPTAYNDLQDALDDAASSGGLVIIYVADGTYSPRDTGDRTATFQLIDDVVIVGGYAGYGEPDPNARDIETYKTILSGDLDGNDVEVADPCDLLNEPTRSENCYHVVTGSGTNATTVLDGFTITGGYADGPASGPEIEKRSGGGIYNEQGSPTIINCIISWNFALVQGGGVGNYLDSDPALSNCSINNNMANTWGGGICNNFDCRVTITNCTFSNNTAGEGGGMYTHNNAEITLTNCIFNGNTTDYDGSGIYHSGVAPVTLTNCDFIGNTSGNDGGGMYKSGPSIASLTSCRFISNTAVNRGGGICSSSMAISNSIISDNTAESGGGVCSRYNANSSLTNCTLTANSASNGNALVCDSYEQSRPSDIQLTNCILWDGGSEVWNNDNSTITINHSDVQGGWPGDGNNIDIDPNFVDPNGPDDDSDTWQDNDYHLQWNSPCINAGDPSYTAGENELDIDGEPRVMLNRVDMGADEVGEKQADFTRDGIINFKDFVVFGRSWMSSIGEENWYVLCDVYKDEQINILDLVEFVNYWLWQASWYSNPFEPEMTYQIAGCDPEAGESSAMEAAAEDLRFTVTVEGSYIHFEDMMAANCCPDELGLEMTVEDDLIIIYETEYTPEGCWCICDYPVTATLGPFEPGTYILELYEDYGGFIGSTTVTIGAD